MWFFGVLGFPSVILANKPLKAMCLSFKMVYQQSTSSLPPFIVDLLTFKVYPSKVQLIFSMGILEGVKWLISQEDYNGPKQQWLTYCKKAEIERPTSCLILSLKSTLQTVIQDNFLYKLLFYTTFLQTSIPESFFLKLLFQKAFFGNCRSRQLSLQTVVLHTTLLAQCHSGQLLFCRLSFQANCKNQHSRLRICNSYKLSFQADYLFQMPFVCIWHSW